jgi:hypothetical protein
MKNRFTPKRKKLFNPDKIAEQLSSELNRDLNAPYPYGCVESAYKYIRKHQKSSFLKKYLSQEEDQGLEAATFTKFLLVNEHMARFNKPIEPRYSRVSYLHSDAFSNVMHRAKSLMRYVLTPFDEDEWFAECKNSTGSSIGVPFMDTSLERKFTFPISISDRARPLFDRYLAYDKNLRLALQKHNEEFPLSEMYSIHNSSRATTVPKTNTINRMICVEPTGNMYFQQGLMTLMYHRMKRVGLDVETLPLRHKRLARESSITSRYATIDWSSASDCVSLELLKWLLPPKWFYAIELVRSRTTLMGDTEIDLAMFSTMGNAVTFPLETLVFWTISQAVLAEDEPTTTTLPIKANFGRTSVFGDDCIVPSESAALFIDCMEKVGFILNQEKTFTGQDGFRESCGGDYLRGCNVRPYNLRAPSSNRKSSLEPWLYIVLNSLVKKYISYFGERNYIYYSSVFDYIFGLFRKNDIRLKVVPDHYPDDAGAKISGDLVRWRRHYDIVFSQVQRDIHGLITFRYCRYVYKDKTDNCDDLRYAVWLKKPIANKREPVHYHRRRVNGGYVVAKGATSCWSLC